MQEGCGIMGRHCASRIGALALALALAAPGVAAAGTITAGWSLTISGNTNVPTFTLQNTSGAGVLLTQFSITIGDTSRHFDLNDSVLTSPPAGGTMSLAPGFGVSAPNRADEAILTFTGFDPGDVAVWTLDLDLDPASNSVQNYRTVMFNNGAAPNAVGTATFVSAQFKGPVVVGLTLPDGATTDTSYTFTASQEVAVPLAAVPVPPALPLLAAALGLFGVVARRRAARGTAG